ncbi:hypothetical protein FBU59_003184 [Linderina macrospora]|uniref:Uncharacterized protein n=1 Tax=Linderina macrospora TaxID=4868 RepID=A0ACC1J914_9FUNG|nr:hypothetical protein FBU59_003184 [Linderina macrospora]
MSLPPVGDFSTKPRLPHLGTTAQRRKNPLVSSKEQGDKQNGGDVVFPSPFGSSYSTIDTIPLDQAEEDMRTALTSIREYKKHAVIVGQKQTGPGNSDGDGGDVEIVDRIDDEGSYFSDE